MIKPNFPSTSTVKNLAEVMLSVDKLKKNYGAFEALKGVSFSLPAGAIIGYLGPNGAGKSTTIKILTLASKPTTGEVLLDGNSIFSNRLFYKGKMGYVPDSPFLYPLLTGREFLNFVADLRNLPLSERDSIDRYVQLFDMQESCERLISGYSMGMRRKVSIIAALLHSPSVLLLDEPTSGLDAISVKQFKDILSGLKKQGVAILLTTHILEVAEKLCDYIYIVRNGQIVLQGTLEEIRKLVNKPEGDFEDIFLAVTGQNV